MAKSEAKPEPGSASSSQELLAEVGDEEHLGFNDLVEVLRGMESDVRRLTQESYDSLPASRRTLYLLGAVTNGALPAHLRAVAAGHLKRLLAADLQASYGALSEQGQLRLRSGLLLTASSGDLDGSVRHKLYECIAQLALRLGEGAWPELPEFLFAPATSTAHKMAAMGVYAEAPSVFARQRRAYLRTARDTLVSKLEDKTASHENRTDAAVTLCSLLIENYNTDGAWQVLADSVTAMIRYLASCLERPCEERLLACFVELAGRCPELLKPHLDDLVDLCLQVIGDRAAPDIWRHQCMETVVALSESSPVLMRALDPARLSQLVSRLFQMIAEGQDQLGASFGDELQRESLVAEEALLRLSSSLKGFTLIPTAADRICTMVGGKDWRERYAALTALNALCSEEALPRFAGRVPSAERLVSSSFVPVLTCLRDPEPKVRHAASTAIGHMAMRFSAEYARRSHDKVIPELLEILTLETQPNVVCSATETLEEFLSACPQDLVVAHLEAVVGKLNGLINTRARYLIDSGTAGSAVTEAALQTMATVAQLVQANFRNFYDVSMPAVRELITYLSATGNEQVRWLALHSATRIGLAVGKEKFLEDAATVTRAVLDLLASAQYRGSGRLLSRAISVAHMTSRILVADGEDFMRELLPEVFKLLALHDSGLVECQAAVCTLLSWYALHTPRALAPYGNEAIERVLPLLAAPGCTVRAAAAECLPQLLANAAVQTTEEGVQTWVQIHMALTAAIERENELNALLSDVCGLEALLGLVSLQRLPADQIDAATLALDKCFKFYFRWRSDEDIESVGAESYESGGEGQDRRDYLNKVLLHVVADILCTLISLLKDSYFTFFDHLAPLVSKLLTRQRAWTEHLDGLAVFNSVLSLGSPGCVRYRFYYLPGVVEHLESNVASVRNEAVRAVGTLADVGGNTFGPECLSAVPALIAIMANPKSRSPDESLSFEAAVIAMTAILEHYWTPLGDVMRLDELFPRFLSWLGLLRSANWRRPLELLCSLLERDEPVVMADQAHVVQVLMDAFAKNRVVKGSALGGRVMACLRRLRQNSLPIEQRDALSDFLSGDAEHCLTQSVDCGSKSVA